MTVKELIDKLNELADHDGENLLCLAVGYNDENGFKQVKRVSVEEDYNGGSRKIVLE